MCGPFDGNSADSYVRPHSTAYIVFSFFSQAILVLSTCSLKTSVWTTISPAADNLDGVDSVPVGGSPLKYRIFLKGVFSTPRKI